MGHTIHDYIPLIFLAAVMMLVVLLHHRNKKYEALQKCSLSIEDANSHMEILRHLVAADKIANNTLRELDRLAAVKKDVTERTLDEIRSLESLELWIARKKLRCDAISKKWWMQGLKRLYEDINKMTSRTHQIIIDSCRQNSEKEITE